MLDDTTNNNDNDDDNNNKCFPPISTLLLTEHLLLPVTEVTDSSRVAIGLVSGEGLSQSGMPQKQT